MPRLPYSFTVLATEKGPWCVCMLSYRDRNMPPAKAVYGVFQRIEQAQRWASALSTTKLRPRKTLELRREMEAWLAGRKCV